MIGGVCVSLDDPPEDITVETEIVQPQAEQQELE